MPRSSTGRCSTCRWTCHDRPLVSVPMLRRVPNAHHAVIPKQMADGQGEGSPHGQGNFSHRHASICLKKEGLP